MRKELSCVKRKGSTGKRLLSGLLSVVMLLSLLATSAFAAEVGANGNTGDTPVELTADKSVFSVTVPTSIAFHIDANAQVTCPSNLSIINHSAGPVEVSGIEAQDGIWTFADFNNGDRSKLAGEKVNSNKLGLALTPYGGSQSATSMDGTQNLSIDSEEWLVPADGGVLAFDADAIATAVTSEISDMIQAAKIVFTVGWKVGEPVMQWPDEYVTSWNISATSADNVMAYLYDDPDNAGMYMLRIIGSGDMMNWSSSPYSPWYSSYRTSITSVTIENGVTSIGSSAFYNCTSLTSVTIPSSVTSIGDKVFHGCTSLTSVTIPSSVTSIGSSAFYGCTNLTSIVIPSGVTSIGVSCFNGCTSLTSIAIPSGVTYIASSTFHGCTSLTSVTIPSSVTGIGAAAFYACRSLTDVYYTGTEEQWSAVSINTNLGYNAFLSYATIHYNS